MNKKLIFRITSITVLVIFILGIYTATKAIINKSNKGIETLNTVAIDSNNYKESDEDLTTVDYKQFYDLLSPHGQWIQVPENEIGIKPKADNNASAKKSPLSGLMGVKDAKVDDFNMGMIFVWKPSPDAGVVLKAGSSPAYVPYSNGQWIYTDQGWYFRAPTPWEETIHHYGRWVYSPVEGWIWVPGRVWAPAWVDWRENDDYVSWAPLPPSVYIDDDQVYEPVIDYNDYIIVERRHFIDPNVYRYNVCDYYTGSGISASILVGTPGLIVSNNIIINRGPDLHYIETSCGRTINAVNIYHTRNIRDVYYRDNAFNVYTPNFRRFEGKNIDVARYEPKSFKRYDDNKSLKFTGFQTNGNNDPRTLKNSQGERQNIFTDYGKSFKNQVNRMSENNGAKTLKNNDNNRQQKSPPVNSGSDKSLKNYNSGKNLTQNNGSYKKQDNKRQPKNNNGSYKNQQRQRMNTPNNNNGSNKNQEKRQPNNNNNGSYKNQQRQQVNSQNNNNGSYKNPGRQPQPKNNNGSFKTQQRPQLNRSNGNNRGNNNPGGRVQQNHENGKSKK